MRHDSAQRIRLAMDAFISVLLWCVNKRKEPPRAAAPIGVANIVGFFSQYADSACDKWGCPIRQGLGGSARQTARCRWMVHIRIFRRRSAYQPATAAWP